MPISRAGSPRLRFRRRRLTVVALCASAVVVLAACGASSAHAPSPSRSALPASTSTSGSASAEAVATTTPVKKVRVPATRTSRAGRGKPKPEQAASKGASATRAATAGPTTGTAAVPASCAHGDSYVWANLGTCGWAGPSNTGYSTSSCAGHKLATNSGSATRTIRVSKANSVISCQNISGCLDITAQHVTIENVKIACSSGKAGAAANGTAVIKIEDGASASVEHTEINGMSGVHACIWHQGTAMTANAVNCYGVDDGIFSWADTGYSSTTGDHFTIENSYFHNFTTKTSNGHIDGYQTEGAAYGLISHNTFLMTSDNNNGTDSAIAIWNSLKNSHTITVTHNLIAGGGFSVYAEDYSPSESNPAGGFTVTAITITDNVFSTQLFGCVGYFGVWFPRGNPTDGWRRSGNRMLATGLNIDTKNPSYKGAACN